MVRIATMDDLARAHEVIGIGRAAMRRAGNTVQWSPDGSTEAAITEDIRQGRCYVMEDEGGIYGVFALVVGDDPTYEYIEGAWRDSSPYGTIHRIASDGQEKGVFTHCFHFALENADEIRIDTHHDNKTMQHVVEKHGFQYCGVISVSDGTPRKAYHYSKTDP